MNITFESKRLTVEPITAPAISLTTSSTQTESQYNSAVLDIMTQKTTEFLPPHWQNINTLEQAKQWLQQQIGDIYAITMKEGIKKDSQNVIVGFVFLYGLNEHPIDEVRIGYIINEQYWGLGLATELIDLITQSLKNQTRASVIIAGVVKENGASIKVLTKNGYEFKDTQNESDFYQFKLR